MLTQGNSSRRPSLHEFHGIRTNPHGAITHPKPMILLAHNPQTRNRLEPMARKWTPATVAGVCGKWLSTSKTDTIETGGVEASCLWQQCSRHVKMTKLWMFRVREISSIAWQSIGFLVFLKTAGLDPSAI